VNAGNSRELPATEATSASKRQIINDVSDEIVPDVES